MKIYDLTGEQAAQASQALGIITACSGLIWYGEELCGIYETTFGDIKAIPIPRISLGTLIEKGYIDGD